MITRVRDILAGRSRAGSIDPAFQALRSAAADAGNSRLPQMAAALSYRTIFGLLPVLAIGLWLLHRLVTPTQLEDLISQGIDGLGFSEIVVNQSAAELVDEGGQGSAESILGDMSMFIPPAAPADPNVSAPVVKEAVTQSLNVWINDFVGRINSISFGAIGLVGLAMLIYAAIGMIVEVERAFNQIFRVPIGRSWSRRITSYWTLLTLGPLALFATFYIGTQVNTWVIKFTGGAERLGSGATSLRVLGFASQFLISGALLLVLYQVVPNTRVRFRPSLIGALVAAAMFEVTKFGFGQYVSISGGNSYARLYGSLALIPLFLLWIYVIWLIVLFGLQLTHYLQHGRANTRPQPLLELGPALVEPAGALTVMTVIARAFNAGRSPPPDAPGIARKARLAEPVARLILSNLTERGLLHRLDPAQAEHRSAEPTYTLARAAAAISVAEVLTLGFELAGHAPGSEGDAPYDAVLERLHRAQIEATGDETLADIVGASRDVAEPPAISASLLRQDPPDPARPDPARPEGPNGHPHILIIPLANESDRPAAADRASPPLSPSHRPEEPSR